MAKKINPKPTAAVPIFNEKDAKLWTEYLKQQTKGQKASLSVQSDISKVKEDELDFSKQLASNEKEILSLVNKKKQAQKELADYTAMYNDLLKGATKETLAQNKELAKEILYGKQRSKQLIDKLEGEIKLVDYAKKSAKLAAEEAKRKQESLEAMAEAIDHAEELVEKYEEMLEPIDELDSWIKTLPAGGLLSAALGLDGIKKKIQDSVVNQLANGKMAGKSMLASLAPLLPLMLAVAAVYKAFEFDKELTKFSKDLDIAKDDALALSVHAEHLAHEMHLVGVTGKEVEATLVEMRKSMGVMANEQSNELVKSMTALRTEMGMTAEESQAFYDTATALNMSVDQLAAEAGTMGESLLGAKETLKEIAKIPKSVVIGFKGTSKELEKAVIKGKLLGLSLEKVSKIGEGMLDIESSIEKQFTAQVLTGKSLNLNAARQYALTGEYGKLQDEILEQAGSLEEFQKMGPLQQKAMAEAMNMTVEEMTAMLTKSKQLNDDYGLSAARAEEILALEEGQAAALTGKEAAFYKMQQEEKKQQEATQKFQESLNKLMMAFEKIAMPVVEALGVAFGYIGNVIDVITLGIEKINGVMFPIKENTSEMEKSMSTALKWTLGIGAAMAGWKIFKMAKGGISKLMGGGAGGGGGLMDKVTGGGGDAPGGGDTAAKQGKSMADRLKGIGDSVKSFFDILRNAAQGIMGIITDVFKGVGQALAGFFEAFKSISPADIGKGALALGAVSVSLWLMGEALQKFADIGLDDLGIAALALIGLTAAVVGLSYILPLIITGSIALGVMSAAFWIFGEAAASVAEAMPAVASGFKLFGDIDGGNLIKVAAGIGALSLALAGYGAGSALSGIGAALGSLFDEDPVEKFNRFATIDAERLMAVANAITALGAAFASFNAAVSNIGDTSSIDGTIDKVIELHDTMSDNSVEQAVNSVASGIGSIFDSAFEWVESVMPKVEQVSTSGGGDASSAGAGGANAVSLATVNASIQELIKKVDQPTVIKFGTKTIDEFESQINLKKSYSSQTDRGYGAFS